MNTTWAPVLALFVVLSLGLASRAGVSLAEVLPIVGSTTAGSTAEMADEAMAPSVETTARLATLRVAGRNCEGRLLGSGFLLPGGLITSEHLVTDAVEAKIDQPVAPVLSAVLRRSAANDLVLLRSIEGVELQLAPSDPAVGEPVLLAGHAGGGATQTVEGRVLQVVGEGDPYGVTGAILLVDAAVSGGFSGGPALNSSGEVVGVIKGYDPWLEITIVVAGSTLRTWLENSRSDAQPTGGC